MAKFKWVLGAVERDRLRMLLTDIYVAERSGEDEYVQELKDEIRSMRGFPLDMDPFLDEVTIVPQQSITVDQRNRAIEH